MSGRWEVVVNDKGGRDARWEKEKSKSQGVDD